MVGKTTDKVRYIRLDFFDADLEEAVMAIFDFPHCLVDICSKTYKDGYTDMCIAIFVMFGEYKPKAKDYNVYISSVYPQLKIKPSKELLKQSDLNKDTVISLMQLRKEQKDLIKRGICWNSDSKDLI